MGDEFHMDQLEKEALLDKYLRGDCTPEERTRVHAWLGALNREDRQWGEKSPDEQQKHLADLYREIRYSLENEAKKPRTTWLRSNIIRVAASLILICGISLLFYRYYPNNSGDSEKYIIEENIAGRIKELRLPDGSHIWLNKGTTLRYSEQFTAASREVFLEGEAFFEVTRDTERPFIIRTAGMQTRVLGTSFNVQAYTDQKAAQVVVVSGKVEVSIPEDPETGDASRKAAGNAAGKNEKLVLTASEMATFTRSERTLKAKKINNTAQYTAWKDGKLIFSQTPMSEVALVLEQTFGLKIKMENPAIGRCRITGRFDKSQAASLTLEAICKSIEAQYRIAGGTVFIRGKGCVQ